MKKTLTLCVLALASCTAPSTLHTIADRETFNAIAPEFSSYVLADGKLTQEQKDRRLLAVETWRMRIEAAEVIK